MDLEEQSHLAQLTAVRQVTNAFLPKPTSLIPLDLPKWMALSTAQDNGHEPAQVQDVLQYFSDLATENSLHDTVAAQKLTDAIELVATIKPKTDTTKIASIRRTSYAEAHQPLTQINHQILAMNNLWKQGTELARKAVYEVPIFNIWDSISLIYTLCVEEIQTDSRAELHLLQFRTIIRILSSHSYMKTYAPTTVAAAWSASPSNGPRSIAFATTCSGKGSNKERNAEARFKFTKSLINGLNKLEAEGILRAYPGGHCPEFSSLVIVCRRPGDYLSLCLTLVKNKIYKMCGHCALLVDALAEMSINVQDLWLTTELGTGRGVEIEIEKGLSYRELLNYDDIKNSLYGKESGV
jgi:hypothetical protein